ncbi:MAG: hypothetical protein EAZ76_09515 [Nostocales cyanobacterium]|nr:MAG: hypothetical protein EAZ87_03715 [Nostocales cyanobacterium]TAF14519.1 MAG: hypothetical protein EAZ76_09515 [Nostocales cyanobacterium]
MLSFFQNKSKLSKSIVFTLAITGVLSGALNFTDNNYRSVAVAETVETIIAQSRNLLPRNLDQKIIRDAAIRSGEKVQDVRISKVTPTTFGNLCKFKFGEVCTEEFRPVQGWVVVVKVKGQSWNYHASQAGEFVIDPQISFSDVSRLPVNISNRVLNDAAQRAGLNRSAVTILRSTQKTFGNSCEFRFGEVCNKIYKPVEGWEVVVNVRTESWTYHVNKNGSQILLDPKIKAVQGAELPRRITEKILSDAYERTRLQTVGITVVRTVERTFSNSCVFGFGEICTQQYDPIQGWEVVVKVQREFWTYHVDRSGSRLVLDPKVVEKLRK